LVTPTHYCYVSGLPQALFFFFLTCAFWKRHVFNSFSHFLSIFGQYLSILINIDLSVWSPTRGGKCYPRWILQINREVENERKPKNPGFDLCFTMFFHNFTKSRIWSYGRYAHSGIRVRPKTRKKDMFAKKGISLKNSSLKLK